MTSGATPPSARGRPGWSGRFYWYGPPVLFALAIFVLSHQPTVPSTPGGDKVAHAVTYAILSALILRALYHRTGWGGRALILGAALSGGLYGVLDEVHQSFVPGRDSSVGDVLADAAGAILGALLLHGVYRWIGASRS